MYIVHHVVVGNIHDMNAFLQCTWTCISRYVHVHVCMLQAYNSSTQEFEDPPYEARTTSGKGKVAALTGVSRSLIHSYTHTLIHSYTHTPIHPYTHTPPHTLIHYLMHTCIPVLRPYGSSKRNDVDAQCTCIHICFILRGRVRGRGKEGRESLQQLLVKERAPRAPPHNSLLSNLSMSSPDVEVHMYTCVHYVLYVHCTVHLCESVTLSRSVPLLSFSHPQA